MSDGFRRVTMPTAEKQPTGKVEAQTLTAEQIASLREEDILENPLITAKSLDIPAILDLQPKDPTMMFRWVHLKGYDGQNYAIRKSQGFVDARPEDIKGFDPKDPEATLPTGTIVDGKVMYIDVVLMKIEKLKLFGHYKRVLEKSNKALRKPGDKAVLEAQAFFASEVGQGVLNMLRAQGKDVSFYIPKGSEVTAQDKDFLS